jgi:predicted metal-dependent peptidase
LEDIDQMVEEMKQAVQDGLNELTEEDKQNLSDEIVDNSQERATTGENGGGQAAPVEPVEVTLKKRLHRFFKSADAFAMNESYRFWNKKNNGDIRMKGRRFSRGEGEQVGIYIDVSGSMSQERLAKAMGTLAALDRIKNIKKTVQYFGNDIYKTFCSGGGTRYDKVFADAKAKKMTSIIIITDDDYCRVDEEYEFRAIFIIGVTNPKYYDESEPYGICRVIGDKRSDKPVKTQYLDCTVVGEK